MNSCNSVLDCYVNFAPVISQSLEQIETTLATLKESEENVNHKYQI